jgi:hypothetical protein
MSEFIIDTGKTRTEPIEKVLRKRTHPQQYANELFLFNVFPNKVDFMDYEYRLGEPNKNGMCPVFVKANELAQVWRV